MITDRIQKIEAKLQGAANLSPETRAELLAALAELRAELEPLHREDAGSIARFADAAAHEAARETPRPAAAEAARAGLAASVEGFEASHPRLVEVANRFANILSNMGI